MLEKLLEKIYEFWITLSYLPPIGNFFLQARGLKPLIELTKNDQSILDIGCGVGHFVSYFSTQEFFAVGLDIHEQSIYQAQKHFRPNGNFIIGDGAFLPFKEKSFDTILLSYALHHIPKNILPECRRIARKKVILVEMRSEFPFRLIDEIWDRLLPYPKYERSLPPPDYSMKVGSNEFLLYKAQ
ncbi:MAG: class I SAM-dependent methyltransferase [Promethearchaeota archaeon]